MIHINVSIITISDKSFRGEREDTSGPLLISLVTNMGANVISTHILPDEPDQIVTLLEKLTDRGEIDLILSTGGTGPSPRDQTPEATLQVIEREMPGLAELLRWDGYRRTPFAVFSRGVAGIRKRTLVVNLPGSPKAVSEGMEVLAPLLPAAIALIKDQTPVDGLCAPQ